MIVENLKEIVTGEELLTMGGGDTTSQRGLTEIGNVVGEEEDLTKMQMI